MQNNKHGLSVSRVSVSRVTVSGVITLLVGGLMSSVAAPALAPLIRPASLALTIPFNGRAAEQEPQQSAAKPDLQQNPDQARDGAATKTTEFTGTVVKTGSDFVLRDAGGQSYQLDTPSKAEPFEGKPVKVTGRLEGSAKLIHVDTISPLTPSSH